MFFFLAYLFWDTSAYDYWRGKQKADFPWTCPGCGKVIEPDESLSSGVRKRANNHKKRACEWYIFHNFKTLPFPLLLLKHIRYRKWVSEDPNGFMFEFGWTEPKNYVLGLMVWMFLQYFLRILRCKSFFANFYLKLKSKCRKMRLEHKKLTLVASAESKLRIWRNLMISCQIMNNNVLILQGPIIMTQ